ncbi:serine acetyltransferase [Ruminococcus sp. AF41-9]|nr:serine acetyltransferase [Ruminococcus sp. AF41-9]
MGIKLGIEIWDNTFDEGLTIYHAGNIVINGMSKIGKNCKLHGSNCIGNDGKSLAAPVIGDNVRLGVGAKVIGDVHIADDVIIAAGAVVIDSCDIKGATLAGVPAKVVKK